jgi:phosphatidylglycerol:prolipoprotein diacylglycerol transferase
MIVTGLALSWIDPVLVDLPGPFAIRWYGMMYVVGFVAAYFVLRFLARRGEYPVPEKSISDFIIVLALGVFLGGRLGYTLFYQFSHFISNPLQIFKVWEGGMSFHGGLIGVLLAALWSARKYKTTFLKLTDGLALAIPFGIFSVRVANFINGELYGRVTSESSWFAMKFFKDPMAQKLLGTQGKGMEQTEKIMEKAIASGKWEEIKGLIPWRHPSQLYEAATEGILTGLLIWGAYILVHRAKQKPAEGFYGGIFLFLYGVFRSWVELYRQPDPQFTGPNDPVGYVLGSFTMGQVLSFLMIPFGAFLFIRAWVRRSSVSS